MSTKMMSISEVADLLGVSQQTIRNWGVVGILNPVRTPGNHRRYDPDEVAELIGRRVCYSYEYTLFGSCRNNLIQQLQSTDNGLIIGYDFKNYSLEEMNVLLYRNFDLCNNKLTDNKESHREFYYKLLNGMFINNLVSTQPMISPNDLIHYKRTRSSDLIVFESEELVCKTRHSDEPWIEDTFSHFNKMAQKIDEEVVDDLRNNAGFVTETELENLNETVSRTILQIKEKNAFTPCCGNFWVVYPPEIPLKHEPEQHGFSVESYRSRIVKDDEILIGFKGKEGSGFHGYCFCPFCLVVTDSEKTEKECCSTKFCSIYAKKLLRGGNFYGKCILVG